jgi:hypothetical protein
MTWRHPYGIGALALAAVAGVLSSAPGSSEAPPRLSVAHGPASPGFFAPGVVLDQERTCTDREPDRFYEFYFTRAIYSEGGGFRGRGRQSWAVDYPKADCQFIVVVKRLAGLDIFDGSYAITLDDPNIRRFPFLYMLEVGQGMRLTDAEVEGLRDYLAAGGFLVVDDFWGSREWANFEREITRVLPDKPIVDLPMDHTLFRIFYDIEEVLQVPNQGNGQAVSLGYSDRTWEQDGYTPHVRGIHDENGRLMVVINWNTDLGDAWEWAESPYYPLKYSTFAFEMGVNMILYSMTH